MAEKILNTRIALKIDSYDNWMASDLILKAGEMALCTIPQENTTAGITNPPQVLAKIGDGTSTFAQLKWMAAVSADVYGWAKAATKPIYSANEITGLADYISGEIQDTDTQYRLQEITGKKYSFKMQSKAKDGESWSDVATLDFSDIDTRLAALSEKVGDKTVAASISDAISGLKMAKAVSAGTGEIISSISQVNGIVSAETHTLVEADIPELSQDKITGLTDALGGKQDTVSFDGEYGADNKAATMSSITNAVGNLKNSDAAVANEFVTEAKQVNGVVSVTRRALEKADIPTIDQDQVSGLGTALANKQDNLEFNTEYNATSNKVATMKDVTNLVADLNGAMHFEGKVEGSTFKAAIAAANKTFAAGDVVLYGYDEYVYDGTEWHVLGNEAIYATKDSVAADKQALETAIGKKQDELSFDGTYSSSNKVATVSTVTAALDGLDNNDAEVANQFVSAAVQTNGQVKVTHRAIKSDDLPALAMDKITGLTDTLDGKQAKLSFDGTYGTSNKAATVSTVTNAVAGLKNEDAKVDNQFVTLVKQTNGVVSVERAQVTAAMISGLADVAKTGSTDDLVQGEKTLVLYCGTASAVI